MWRDGAPRSPPLGGVVARLDEPRRHSTPRRGAGVKWRIYKADGKGRGARGTSLGTIDAPSQVEAFTKALEKYRSVGLTVANAIVEESKPEY